jgi:iron transport multicopper oxidase
MTLETIPHPELGVISLGEKIFVPPAVPVLLQILSGARKAEDMLPNGAIYTLPPNKTIEITMPGDARVGPVSIILSRFCDDTNVSIIAPFPLAWGKKLILCLNSGLTLYQHDFWVVKAVDGTTPKWNNAIMRDTVNAGLGNQSVTIR